MSASEKRAVAVINPREADGLARTLLDGFSLLAERGDIELKLSSSFEYDVPLSDKILSRPDFISFARKADAVVLINGKYGTDVRLAEDVDSFEKTAFIDGSELGGNNRLDVEVLRRVLDGTYKGKGAIDKDMLARCLLYMRREKPYVKGVVPLPFGIESLYTRAWTARPPKDIDFVCIFGQEEYPPFRRYVREELERFCKKEGFVCVTDKMPRSEFYRTLARAKVGVSVGGGGFDTLRFWEILGANAVLMTETIDIFPKYDTSLDFERIWQFNNLFDFSYELERVGAFLKEEYTKVFQTKAWQDEYDTILATHGSIARAQTVLNEIAKRRP